MGWFSDFVDDPGGTTWEGATKIGGALEYSAGVGKSLLDSAASTAKAVGDIGFETGYALTRLVAEPLIDLGAVGANAIVSLGGHTLGYVADTLGIAVSGLAGLVGLDDPEFDFGADAIHNWSSNRADVAAQLSADFELTHPLVDAEQREEILGDFMANVDIALLNHKKTQDVEHASRIAMAERFIEFAGETKDMSGDEVNEMRDDMRSDLIDLAAQGAGWQEYLDALLLLIGAGVGAKKADDIHDAWLLKEADNLKNVDNVQDIVSATEAGVITSSEAASMSADLARTSGVGVGAGGAFIMKNFLINTKCVNRGSTAALRDAEDWESMDDDLFVAPRDGVTPPPGWKNSGNVDQDKLEERIERETAMSDAQDIALSAQIGSSALKGSGFSLPNFGNMKGWLLNDFDTDRYKGYVPPDFSNPS